VELTVNGEPHTAPAGTTISGLFARLGLNPVKIAVELNLEIVPKSRHSATVLCDGDRVEIVQFVGGG